MSLALNTIHVGDCRELLAQMPDESVNCVVTSPPYWGLRDYGTATWEGGEAACEHRGRVKPRQDTSGGTGGRFAETRGEQPAKAFQAVPVKGTCRCGAVRIDQQIGLEETPQQYVETMVAVFREVRRVLRSDGTLWLNLGDCYATGAGKVGEHPGGGEQGARWTGKTRADRDGTHAGKHTAMAAMGPMTQPNRMPIEGLKPKDLVGIPWRVAFALQADGWWLRCDVVWHKRNPMPESVRDRPTKAHEYLFLLSKSEKYFYDADAIREPMSAPEASTTDDVARAFSRRRETIVDPTQRPLSPEDMEPARRRSGNKERQRRDGAGGVYGHASHQAYGVPREDTDGLRNRRSVWTLASEPYPEAHFATFPQKLVEPCVLAGCPVGGVVLDPFGGSGTVARVAEDLGRRWVLFDLNPEYAAMARRRTAQQGLLGRAAPAHATNGAPAAIPPCSPTPSAESGGSGVTETTGDTARTAWGPAADILKSPGVASRESSRADAFSIPDAVPGGESTAPFHNCQGTSGEAAPVNGSQRSGCADADDPCEAKGADSPSGGLSASPAKSAPTNERTDDGRTERNRLGGEADAKRQSGAAARVERKGDVPGVSAGHSDQRQHGEGDGTARGHGAEVPALRDDADGGRRVRSVAVQPDGPAGGRLGVGDVADPSDLAADAGAVDVPEASGKRTAPAAEANATDEVTHALANAAPRAAGPAHNRAPAAPKRLDIRLVSADGAEQPYEVTP